MKKRSQSVLLGILLIGAATVLMLASRPRERLLLQRARKIGATPRVDSRNRFPLSDHEMLVLRDTSRLRDVFHEDYAQNMFAHDVGTGVEMPLPRLAAWFNTLVRPYNFDITPSPDGTWLLFTQHSAYLTGSAIASRDGSRHREAWRPYVPGYSAHWMSDSRHWVELIADDQNGKTTVLIHDLFDSLQDKPRKASLVFPPDIRDVPSTLQFLTSDRLVGASWKDPDAGDNPPNVRVIEQGFEGVSAPVRRFNIPIPSGYKIDEIVFSPNGAYIAWVFDYSYIVSPLRALLHRIFSAIESDSHAVTGLWVSRLDGSDWHEIGHVDTRGVVPDENNAILKSLSWLSDGRHLSFEFADDLYTTPID